MARTKATVGAKVSSVKNSKVRDAAAPPPSSHKTDSGRSGFRSTLAGCNPVCPRETPTWQLPITTFFHSTDSARADGATSSSRVVQPASSELTANPGIIDLDTSTDPDLPPLSGEDCHKIAEYFPKVSDNNKDRHSDISENDKEAEIVNSKNADEVQEHNNNVTKAKRSLDEADVSVSKKVKLAV